jgi:uncharacterized protein (TIGR00661 family)
MTRYAPRALFAISSLGLGHATRSLVIIREYLQKGYVLTVVSAGGSLQFLRRELAGEKAVMFREMDDYPPLERGTGWRMYWYLCIDLLRTWRIISNEHRQIQESAAEYDFIFSDGRYGFHSPHTPSFILSHQVAFIPPRGLREASWMTEYINVAALRKFDCLFIPDYPWPSLNLAGHLSHTPNLHRCPHRYIGLLSSYRHLNLEQNIDYLFVISGYLEEHKDSFVLSLLEQAKNLPGRKVFILGSAGSDDHRYNEYNSKDMEIHDMASGMVRQELFNRARTVISRAGYTTVMDLVEHGKNALLIPTPNQTEQEYLAYYLGSHGYFATRRQHSWFDLHEALQDCQGSRRFMTPWKTAESLRRITGKIDEMLHQHFFSIIVPAHNEEAELESTLQSLLAQHYPENFMEILVVENGSTDNTLHIARKIAGKAEHRDRIRVIQSERGVSRAKNTGIKQISAESDWVIFCDADTFLGPHFLHSLNTWLNRHGRDGLSIGTTSVRPHPSDSIYARLWFKFYNMVHRRTKSSFAIQIARAPIARGIPFNEELHFAEDLLYIRECRRYGRFFFVSTSEVSTSTRRFEARGYFGQSIRWLYESLLPLHFKLRKQYDVIR